MRSDVRKRLEAAARRQQPAPIRIYRIAGDWEARCDHTCARPLRFICGYHTDALEAALGHACLFHGSTR